MYGAAPPVRYSDRLFNLEIPRGGARAGVSCMLGAAVGELFAVRHVEGFRTVCAVDFDPQVVPWFASNNAAIQVPGSGQFPGDDVGDAGFPIICADVGDWSGIQIFVSMECHVFTASIPCGPWSTLGRQKALHHSEGEAILSCLKLIRLLQPVAICFENVAGFRASPHCKAFLRQLHLSGFRLVFSETHDLRELTYTSRRRWLAVAVNTLYIKGPNMPLIGADRFKRPITFDPKLHVLVNLAGSLLEELQVTHEEMRILQQYQGSAKTIRAGSVLPTVTASYRASLGFSKEMLDNNGLFAWSILSHSRSCWSQRGWKGSLAISLIAKFWQLEDGGEPALLASIQHGACGISLVTPDQLSKLLCTPSLLSTQECAAVVVGEVTTSSTLFPMASVQFPAEHETAGMVLLKGTLVNFRKKLISFNKSTQNYELQQRDIRVVTFEVHASHCSSWASVQENPLRFIWKHFPKIQSKILNTWARRWFQGRKAAQPSQASSFHCFGRMLAVDVDSILKQSGQGGVFVTPTAETGLADGRYRVIWLETNELDHALALVQTQTNVAGVVKGRTNLG